ncbi:LOW QUALITY PROTEIN: hypothetical protein PoB_004181700 [Plakobranchus ocellatus]|uniref:Uncharacterized protein n=1 Tax=Plakobranchus ocellatus TaxID=259542 RepID=A0AAV4B831_9GAST|nr:LOW QUALITY PROTEIN: hypothetical protein PoB_004181700 [Plakobranchus ocellatus]
MFSHRIAAQNHNQGTKQNNVNVFNRIATQNHHQGTNQNNVNVSHRIAAQNHHQGTKQNNVNVSHRIAAQNHHHRDGSVLSLLGEYGNYRTGTYNYRSLQGSMITASLCEPSIHFNRYICIINQIRGMYSQVQHYLRTS